MSNLIDTKDKSNDVLMVEVSRLYRRIMQTTPSFLSRENYRGTPESPKALKHHDCTIEVGYFNPTEKGPIFVMLKSGTGDDFTKALHALIAQLNATW